MQHWSTKRKASLAVHLGIVLIPFIFATTSAAHLWYALFQDWWVAIPIVVAFDVTALIGLVLYIARIESPFQVLRHFLPVVSIAPLGIELYQLLSVRNDALLSVGVSVVVTTAMTLIAWRCYVTIERLFVSPEVAAREKTLEQVRGLTLSLLTAADMQAAVGMAVKDWSERTALPSLTGNVIPVVSTQAVKAHAAKIGVSERTVWRRLETGKLTAADILEEEEA